MQKKSKARFDLRQPDGKRQEKIIKWWNYTMEPSKEPESQEVNAEDFALPTKQDYVEELKAMAYDNPAEVSGWGGWHDEQIAEKPGIEALFEDPDADTGADG